MNLKIHDYDTLKGGQNVINTATMYPPQLQTCSERSSKFTTLAKNESMFNLIDV